MGDISEYTINLSNGSVLCTVPEETIDAQTTSVSLIGKGITDYGETQNENFVHLLENFAGVSSPKAPLKGQFWFRVNTNDKGESLNTFDLLVNNGTQANPDWKLVANIVVSEEEPIGATAGNVWFNSHSKVLSIYDGTTMSWIPAGVENYLHVDNVYKELITASSPTSAETTLSYLMPQSLILRNFQSDLEKQNDMVGKGVLNYIQYTVLGKEAYDDSETAVSNKVRAIVLTGYCVVQTIKNMDDTYSVDIIGGNTMNTLAAVKNSETWRAGFEQVGNNIYLRIIGDTQPNSRISWILNIKTTAV